MTISARAFDLGDLVRQQHRIAFGEGLEAVGALHHHADGAQFFDEIGASGAVHPQKRLGNAGAARCETDLRRQGETGNFLARLAWKR